MSNPFYLDDKLQFFSIIRNPNFSLLMDTLICLFLHPSLPEEKESKNINLSKFK